MASKTCWQLNKETHTTSKTMARAVRRIVSSMAMSSQFSNNFKEGSQPSVVRTTSARKIILLAFKINTSRKRLAKKIGALCSINHSYWMWTIKSFLLSAKTLEKTSHQLTRQARNSMKRSWRMESLSTPASSQMPSLLSTSLESL